MSKSRKRRILGMTSTQFIILGCLALAAIGTIFGSFILISGSTTPGSGQAVQPQPTGQPIFLNESDPFSAATLPVLGEGIPPDWKEYTATTISLKLPPQFESVNNIDFERQERIVRYRSQGYEFLAARLEGDPFDYRFWFNYPQPETVPYAVHVVVKADFLPTLTLDEYIDQTYDDKMQGFMFADRQEFEIENLQARRILLEAPLAGSAIRVVEYIITDDINLWVISCGSTVQEFDAWLPIFDRIATSFRLLY
jgi:hypothetical protein